MSSFSRSVVKFFILKKMLSNNKKKILLLLSICQKSLRLPKKKKKIYITFGKEKKNRMAKLTSAKASADLFCIFFIFKINSNELFMRTKNLNWFIIIINASKLY